MISWRNKAIDNLSEQELRTALNEAVGQMITSDPNVNYDMQGTINGFIAGLSVGVLFMVVAFATGFMAA